MSEALRSLWIEHQPSLWDQVAFQLTADGTGLPVAFPFRCRYRGQVGMKLDRREAVDKDGGASHSSGRKGATLVFTLLLYEDEHLVVYAGFMRALRALQKAKQLPKVLVHHPALNVLGIRELAFLSATLPARNSSKEVLTSTLTFVEDLATRPVVSGAPNVELPSDKARGGP